MRLGTRTVTPTSVRFAPETLDRVREEAERRQMSLSGLMEVAVLHYLGELDRRAAMRRSRQERAALRRSRQEREAKAAARVAQPEDADPPLAA